MEFPWRDETRQFFADAKRADAPTDFEEALRSWLWFSCSASERVAVEEEIRVRRTLLKHNRDSSVEALPVETINGREYAIEGRRQTPDGYERIDAVDLTAMDEIKYESSRPLRLRGHAFIIYPDEGHTSMVCCDGSIRWVDSYAMALSSSPSLREQLMDELEQSVDAGGSLQL